MTTSKELNLARKSLVVSLGENAKVYFEKMKLWFQMKITKEEFDCEARNIMSEDQVHLHNEFLLCLFNKVQGLATSTTIRPTKINNSYSGLIQNQKEKKLRLKRKYKTDKSNFEPADIYVDVLSQTSSPVGDEPIGANRSSAQELILPDRTFVLARLMLAAWENNMDGAEESTAHIIIAATHIFLKNIITAIITRKKGFSVRDKTFIYNIGEPVPSSWKRNSTFAYQSTSMSCTLPTYADEAERQVPAAAAAAVKPNLEEAEQTVVLSLACATQTMPPCSPLVSIADLQTILKVYKNLVNNHTLYATNVERLFTYNTHSTWEDLESRQLLRRRVEG